MIFALIEEVRLTPYMFKTQYKYDSFGRMRNIIYPDGEVVHYGYATGGLLKTVAGSKNGMRPSIYLANRIYDEQGRKVSQIYGNGVWTEYTYDPNRQWLDKMYTELPSRDVLQDLQYTYDPVSNITEIDQKAPSPSGTKLGGPYDNHYDYDQQYRLEDSHGGGTFPYSFYASYSPSGRLGTKYTGAQAIKSDLSFGYDDKRMTHQPRTMFDGFSKTQLSFFWDANGNLAQTFDCNDGAVRFHQWDDVNRLRMVLGLETAGFYGYDAHGDRVYKLFGDCDMVSLDRIPTGPFLASLTFNNATLYPNPYITITCQGYTKHYFAGNERVASSEGNGQWIGPAITPIYGSHDEDVHRNTFKPYNVDFPLGNDMEHWVRM